MTGSVEDVDDDLREQDLPTAPRRPIGRVVVETPSVWEMMLR